jgi:hypothetical protein
MEYRKHFYITLFSNASQKTYPENKLAVYKSFGADHRPGFDKQFGGEGYANLAVCIQFRVN